MNDLFVPYNIALALKEIGFDESCFGYWEKKNKLVRTEKIRNKKISAKIKPRSEMYTVFKCTAPVYDQVIDWFVEKHNIDISVKGDSSVNEILGWDWDVDWLMSWPVIRDSGVELSRKEALNKAIEKAISFIKEKK